MLISSHAKLRIFLSLVAVVAIMGTFAIFWVSPNVPTYASGSAVRTFSGRHLTTSRAANMQLSLQAKTQAQAPLTNGKLRVRMTPLLNKSSANAVRVSPAATGSAPHATTAGTNQGKLLHNFKGLNSVDNFNANGFILEPPDQGLCVGFLGKRQVVNEIINDVTAFYTPTGR